jgi:hypothetical protein
MGNALECCVDRRAGGGGGGASPGVPNGGGQSIRKSIRDVEYAAHSENPFKDKEEVK